MSMNTRLLLITFLCVFSIGQCIAQTWYTGKDNFRQAISKTVFYPITIIKPKKISST